MSITEGTFCQHCGAQGGALGMNHKMGCPVDREEAEALRTRLAEEDANEQRTMLAQVSHTGDKVTVDEGIEHLASLLGFQEPMIGLQDKGITVTSSQEEHDPTLGAKAKAVKKSKPKTAKAKAAKPTIQQKLEIIQDFIKFCDKAGAKNLREGRKQVKGQQKMVRAEAQQVGADASADIASLELDLAIQQLAGSIVPVYMNGCVAQYRLHLVAKNEGKPLDPNIFYANLDGATIQVQDIPQIRTNSGDEE